MRFVVLEKKTTPQNLSGSFPKIWLLENGGSCTFYKSPEKIFPQKELLFIKMTALWWLSFSLCPPLAAVMNLTKA